MNTIRRFVCALLVGAGMPLAFAREPAVVATYAYTRYDRAAALAPLAAHLEKTTGAPVVVRVLDSPRALAAALRDGSIDLAVTNTFVYLGVRDERAIRALAVFDVPAKTLDAYRGVLLARRAAASDIAAVRGGSANLRYVQVIPGSTSGGLMQDLHLAAQGLDASRFAAVRHAGTHDAALAALQDASADVAALADAPWQAAQRGGAVGAVVELWRSPPIPPGPVVCRDGGRIDCARAAAVLATLHERAPEVLAALVAAWSEASGATRLVAPDAAAYDALTAGFADPAAGRAALDRLL
ncbi:MAG TPA: PhnD/SsuA/transferrin family substrate-binding protein [Tahibacter sp.]|uniref:phosphate/phosphite/phosphonate ABC transporter substrate-binding protein n=1 Tax=Tahibacter sp. TaxID=2056211 RepID=UPI002C05BA1A|nr:PhnD/SsuA/transferrin family substrate-binding protein [Tahibacter sp.]HSX59906.1 PhnD/SsuA/transferrin family substrate-binding protein [Tahibacter sp.]